MGEPTHTMETAAGRSLVRRVFGVVGRRETYRNLVYLLARFPIGIAYFTTITTLLSLGVGLLPVIVGVPILVGVVALGGYIGVVEAGLLNHLRGRQLSYEPADPTDSSLRLYLKTVVTTPRNYLLLAFGVVSFGVGTSVFSLVVTGLSLGVALVFTPLLYVLPGTEVTTTTQTVELGTITVDAAVFQVTSLPEALVASLVGVVVILAGCHLVNAAARAFEAVTAWVLGVGASSTTEP